MSDFGSKTLNHASLMNEGKETRVLVTAHIKEKVKIMTYNILTFKSVILRTIATIPTCNHLLKLTIAFFLFF